MGAAIGIFSHLVMHEGSNIKVFPLCVIVAISELDVAAGDDCCCGD